MKVDDFRNILVSVVKHNFPEGDIITRYGSIVFLVIPYNRLSYYRLRIKGGRFLDDN